MPDNEKEKIHEELLGGIKFLKDKFAQAEEKEEARTSEIEEVKAQIAEIAKEMSPQTSKNTRVKYEPVGDNEPEPAKEKGALAYDKKYGLVVADYDPIVKAGTKYDGIDKLDLLLACHMVKAEAQRKGTDFAHYSSEDLQKALTSTTAGSGDEWVPTNLATTLWEDWEKQSLVASLISTIPMPTNPYDIPIKTAEVTVYYNSTENTGTTASDPTSAKDTLTAGKLMAECDFSYEVDEDSAVAIAPLVRGSLADALAAAMDSVVLNGDTTTGTGNINYMSSGTGETGSIAATNKVRIFDGLRHYALVDNTGMKASVTGATVTGLHSCFKLLDKYATRPSRDTWVTDIYTYLALLTDSNLLTVDKYGGMATEITGELGRMFGAPIVTSEELGKTNASGYIQQTAAANTKGSGVILHRPSWVKGFRREVMIEIDRDIQKQTHIMVISIRPALQCYSSAAKSSGTQVGAFYNTTV